MLCPCLLKRSGPERSPWPPPWIHRFTGIGNEIGVSLFKGLWLLEQLGMCPKPNKFDDTKAYPIDEEPITLDVTFSVLLELATQPVVTVLLGEWFAGDKLFKHIL